MSSTLNFVGVVSTAFAPAAVLFFSVVADRPVLIILLVFAAFFWLCTITIVAALWSVLIPAKQLVWLLILYATALQEGCRWGTYALFERLIQGLQSAGLLAAIPNRTTAHVVPASIASGLGAGVMQALVMYGDVFGGSLRPGTLYTPACRSLSVFAVDALCSCAFIVLNVLLSILGWTSAYPRKSPGLLASIVGLHVLASGATSLNDPAIGGENGCALALPCLFAVVVAATALTAHVARVAACSAPLKGTSTQGPPDPAGGRGLPS